MDVSPQKQWHCDHCPSIFGRLDHLKRHVMTHTAERSHVCQFCGSVFTRGDVLRRHWKSCKSRIENDKEIPDSQQGGKPKHACDNCASIRKACDGEIPCSECIYRARVCTYQRLRESDRNAAAIPQAETNHHQEVCESQGSDSKISTSDEQGSWDLGLQNFYPSSRETSRIVYSRNRYGT
ncbi:hypothetical protein PENSTE_c005G05234 [Penicillium steckii]|uniref:C2H2-type domain-containing protein n=1 Tax=Penicillium steckii TaxID=303698 RepID=A0A1V6TKS7_9EURO|nr:hypothetical protein PENSTE_c005G05234 [Penicillium steckii]